MRHFLYTFATFFARSGAQIEGKLDARLNVSVPLNSMFSGWSWEPSAAASSTSASAIVIAINRQSVEYVPS